MKRFSETDKWRDPWFRSLSAPAKLVFLYVIDNCNNAGFLELDKELLVIFTKMKSEHLEGALEALKRGIIGASGWVWVRRFLRHQKNEDLNPENPAHKQIISLLKDQVLRFGSVAEFKDFIAPYRGLLSSKGIGIGKVKVQKAANFEKPTLEQAKSYGASIGMINGDVEGWYDHFESNGWRVGGKAKMTDWQAAMRNSKRKGGQYGTNIKSFTESGRGLGTANEGKSSQYAGIGKIKPIQNAQ